MSAHSVPGRNTHGLQTEKTDSQHLSKCLTQQIYTVVTPQDLSYNTAHCQASGLTETNCVALIAAEVRPPDKGLWLLVKHCSCGRTCELWRGGVCARFEAQEQEFQTGLLLVPLWTAPDQLRVDGPARSQIL